MLTMRRIAQEIGEIIGLLMLVFLIRTMVFSLYKVPSGSMETTMLVGEYYFADKLSYWFRAPKRGEVIACNQPTYVYSTNPVIKLLEQYISIPWVQWGPENWTKRIIGLPGEHVRGVVENGVAVIYINGERLDEPYVNKYPLITMWVADYKEIENRIKLGRFDGPLTITRSYDPTLPFNKQPFYTINEARLVKDYNGALEIKQPGRAWPDKIDSRMGTNQNYWNGCDTFNVRLGQDEYWIMGDNRLGSTDSRFFGPIKKESIHARILWRLWSIDSDEAWTHMALLKHPIDFWSYLRWNRFFTAVV